MDKNSVGHINKYMWYNMGISISILHKYGFYGIDKGGNTCNLILHIKLLHPDKTRGTFRF